MRTDRPVVIDDDEPDSTDDEDEDVDEDEDEAEAEATRSSVNPSSVEQDANPYSALLTQDTDSELCEPIIPSSPRRWYDVEAGCYVDEEPAPHSLPKPLDEDGGGDSVENVSDLERDMLLAFEEQEKSSSATALSSPQPPCRYTEQSSPQIDQEDDQGDTSHNRLGYSSPLCEQDHGEELQEQHLQQQQQEVAVQAMREDDDDDDDWEQRGEKQRHQDEIEQIRTNVYHSKNSNHSHNTSNEDEDPRPAKRRKFRLRRPRSLTPPNEDSDGSESPRPAKQRQPSSNSDPTSKHDLQRLHKRLTAPVQTQLEQPSSILHSDRRQSKIDTNPTSIGVEESILNASAEYQEWPMSGVFKRVIVGDEVRYGMEFSLEGSHGLMCTQHTVAHNSTNGRDSQPGALWEICRITSMREVDGVQEFRVAWAQTWMPESELGGARELVDEFKARLSVRHGKSGQGKTDVTGERPAKRRRGRPRKRP